MARAYRRHRPRIAAGGILALSVAFAAIDMRGIWGAGAPPFGPSPWWGLTTVAVGCVLVATQPRFPLPALVLGTLVFALDGAWFGTLGMVLVMHELVYSATASLGTRGRRWMLVAVVAAVAVIAGSVAAVSHDLRATVLAGLLAFALLGTPYWWATAVRRAEEVGELHAARADDAARLGELREAESVRRERERMADELHDVVAGRLAAVALHSEAALDRDAQPDADRAALVELREAGVRGLAEMREMILLLRRGAEPLVAAERLDQLAGLLRETTDPGQAVSLEAHDLPALPTMIDQTAARVVREALVNAAKHAPGASTAVRLRAEDGALHIDVRTAGARPGRGPGTGTGLGLEALRRRVEATGGVFAAGPDGEDWLVRAVLPIGLAP